MYTDGAQTAGFHRVLQHGACHGCLRPRQPNGPGRRAGRTAPRGRDRTGASAQRSPQRRPVFAGPGHHDPAPDPDPAQRSPPPEAGLRRLPPVPPCGCAALVPHPLPHLQVRGHGHRHRRSVRYVTVDEQEEEGCGCSSGPRSPPLPLPNGLGGAGPAFLQHGAGRDSHQDRAGQRGGSEDCNGQSGAHRGFFPTEVPQQHLNQSRRRTPPHAASSGVTSPESSIATTATGHRCRASEAARQKGRRDSVRDQIRQVVTDLEDVLGGLKQVHVEMKEVVQQIDRLTANMDLGDETPAIAQESTSRPRGSARAADAGPVLADEDRIILRTNSPSPVHVASVVKTSRFTPPAHARDADRPAANGHLPHMCPPGDPPHSDPHQHQHPRSLDPKVIVGNSTSTSKNHKPPPYPQNGRCGKGLHAPPRPLKTPAHPSRGRQSTSMV
ncbi:uncharacterized protein si:ch211-178n15.1 [Betta splendens]|uniref:Uncharacterized protein si:ch211-178n15.1 n=1 Tax=Betta splendens TaxID=158456 RepID=A0A6P7L420_BETSP|nr:uncharacterized protein si:ch211-178n15.1 [Betta splendens]XP_028988685.1 uncharacterized protein si:ch211-178n15.1 [Betta splendens]